MYTKWQFRIVNSENNTDVVYDSNTRTTTRGTEIISFKGYFTDEMAEKDGERFIGQLSPNYKVEIYSVLESIEEMSEDYKKALALPEPYDTSCV